MTSILGVLWTCVQSVGWLFYFLRQLISDALNINYRLVSAVGHLIAGVTKIVYVLFSSVSLALYETVNYLLLTIAGVFWFATETVYFVVHCCVLLVKIVYYTVTGIADGVLFVLLMPMCACRTVHSWLTWIFSGERWLNAATWFFQTCSSATVSAADGAWLMIAHLIATANLCMSTVAVFMQEGIFMICSIISDTVSSLYSDITDSITSLTYQAACLLSYIICCLQNFFLAVVVDPAHGLLQLCANNYLCLIPVLIMLSAATLVLRWCRMPRLLPRFLRGSRGGEIIHIHLDYADGFDVSDDEMEQFQDHHMFPQNADDVEEEDVDYSVTDNSSIEISDDDDDDGTVGTDSDFGDSDADTIDMQLDQPSASHQHHCYATRSKGTVSQVTATQPVEPESERTLCVICRDQVKSVLVLPCRHMCMCVNCARTLVTGAHGQRRICPLCRGNIDIVMNVYT